MFTKKNNGKASQWNAKTKCNLCERTLCSSIFWNKIQRWFNTVIKTLRTKPQWIHSGVMKTAAKITCEQLRVKSESYHLVITVIPTRGERSKNPLSKTRVTKHESSISTQNIINKEFKGTHHLLFNYLMKWKGNRKCVYMQMSGAVLWTCYLSGMWNTLSLSLG